MILKKAKTLCLPVVCCMALALVFFQAPAKCYGEDYEINIDVAPNVLNIQSKSTIVTVHTDIAFRIVDGESVTLNGVEINYSKADDRGYFVAKFLSDEIKALYEAGELGLGYNTLRLLGVRNDDIGFWGEQDIMVIDNVPEATGKK